MFKAYQLDPPVSVTWRTSMHGQAKGAVSLQVPRDELSAEEWLTIKSIVRSLEVEDRDWKALD